MKKFIIVLIVIMLVLLCACGNGNIVDWALDQDYSFSVEQDGSYEFKSYVFDKEKIPAIYDVYVNGNLIGSIGGFGDNSITQNLQSGDSVLVKFNHVLGEKGNRLQIISE